MKVPAVLTPATRMVGKLGFTLKQHSPTILVGLGIVGFGTAVVEGCKASTKLEPLLKEFEERLGGREKTRVDKAWLIKRLAKLYGPTMAIFLVSTGFVLGGYKIIGDRYSASVELCRELAEGFALYRSRVRNDLGEEKDLEYCYGGTKDKEDSDSENKETVDCKPKASDPNGYSIYARVFDESNIHWSKNPGENLIFLKAMQSLCNDKLHARGYLFLSEVYELLDFKEDKASRIVGWMMKPGNDNYVDFGIYNILNDRKNAFINGYEPNVILDFNVDGVIFDKI